MPFRPYVAPGVQRKASRAAYMKHKEAARALVASRLPQLNRSYGFKYGRISIRNQKFRWGSCSAGENGVHNLNFNYRLALIPPHLADYIIVHELCHIGEMNHSSRFWALVARTMPDYKAMRAELRRTGMSIS